MEKLLLNISFLNFLLEVNYLLRNGVDQLWRFVFCFRTTLKEALTTNFFVTSTIDPLTNLKQGRFLTAAKNFITDNDNNNHNNSLLFLTKS